MKFLNLNIVTFLFCGFITHSLLGEVMSPKPKSRPVRAGHIKLSPETDFSKPVAFSSSGWTKFEDVLVGTYDSKWLGAISTDSFKHRWWSEVPSELSVQASAHKGSLLVGFKDGSLWKMDLASGDKLWEQKLDSFLAREPLILDATIIVVSANQSIYALDSNNGKIKWVQSSSDNTDLTVQKTAPVSLHAQSVLLGLANGDVNSYDLDKGDLLWNYSSSNSNDSSRFKDVMGPIQVVGSSMIITRYDGLIESVSLNKNRSVIWKKETFGISDNVLSGGRLFVGTVNGHIIAYNPATGEELWNKQVANSIGSLYVKDEKIFACNSEGLISAINAIDGELLWYDTLSNTVVGKPIELNHTVYFQTANKNLYGYKIR